MRGGVNVRIPVRGINNQVLDDQSLDGLCDSIVNLKPKGRVESPYWVPFEKINSLSNDSSETFTYEFGLSSITDAFWQVRNFVGEFSEDTDGSLKRLLVLCQNSSRKCIDIIEPTTWTVVKTQALPQEGTYMMSCTRLDQVTIINITRDRKPFLLYYLVDDVFIPQGWPEMPAITFSTTTETFTSPEIEAGTTEGVLRKTTDQWFLVTWAFRLFDGTHVRHQQPILSKVDAEDPVTEAVLPVFTLDGYSEIENLLVDQPFWKLLIAGISVCATLPQGTEKAALDDGVFFEVGYWPWIDKLPSSEWPTVDDPNIITVTQKSDSWATNRGLGIDEFTHHKFCGNVVDTYNKRLLLGGRAVDFALPKIPTNAFQNTVPGGVYSDYMTYVSGLATFVDTAYDEEGNALPSVVDPEYSYEINYREYSGNFSPKTGREFKTVEIVDNVPTTGDVNPPGGGTGLPNANFSAAIVGTNLEFGIQTTETNFGSGGQFTIGGAWMKIKVTIGPTGEAADETIYVDVSPLGNVAPFFNFSDILLEADSETPGAGIYHVITIRTDSGTYKRILTGSIGESDTEVTLPEVIWYPDRRATQYELIVLNGSTYEVALSKQLNRHPESNYSYVILTELEQTYTLGSSLVSTTEPDVSVNDVLQYIPNLVQASISGSPFLFDSAAAYRIGNRENEIVMGFGVNINKTNEGQAGQFPVYAFSNTGIWALEQIGDPTVAFGKITPVSNFNGINNPYAITNAGQLIICTDNKYIYALAGMDVQRIDEAIANDADYEDFLKQVRIGYHRAKDYEELIFSNPFFDYSLCYNLKYKEWYKATERFKFFFYDYPGLMGLTVDNVLKDFDDKDLTSPVAWSLSTRPWNLGEPYELKRLFPTYLRMRMKQPLQENAEDYLPVQVQLKAYRDAVNLTYTLKDTTYKTDQLGDVRIYNQNGSFYAYRIIMSGTNAHEGSYIHEFDGFFEKRYEFTRRRLDCSAQFLYADGEVGISICNCEGGSGTDAYFPFNGSELSVTSIVIYHGLGKVPGAFVTDINGLLIRVTKQLIFLDDNPETPDLMRMRLIFDEPQPFMAYFG